MGLLGQRVVMAIVWPVASRLVTRSSEPGLKTKVAIKAQIAAAKREV